jgi:hypothetical protein
MPDFIGWSLVLWGSKKREGGLRVWKAAPSIQLTSIVSNIAT